MRLFWALRSLSRALDELATFREAGYGATTTEAPPRGVPDLHSQLEELFDEVWRQEAFERSHPLTCDALRDRVRK